MKLALVVLLALACAHQASANAYFGAVADADGFTTIAVGSMFEHEEVVEWAVNATDVAPGPVSIAIVDGNPPNVQPVVKLWSGEVDASGELSGAGSFTAADIEPTVQMPADALFADLGHGHFFLEVTTAQGTLYGVWQQTDANGSPMPKDDGHDHEHGADAAAGAPSTEVQAQADGHDHGHDHSGHSHRRMLSA